MASEESMEIPGPFKSCLKADLRSDSEEKILSNTASPMEGTEHPSSKAESTVQVPVPFMWALSLTISTKPFPVFLSLCSKTLAVISVR